MTFSFCAPFSFNHFFNCPFFRTFSFISYFSPFFPRFFLLTSFFSSFNLIFIHSCVSPFISLSFLYSNQVFFRFSFFSSFSLSRDVSFLLSIFFSFCLSTHFSRLPFCFFIFIYLFFVDSSNLFFENLFLSNFPSFFPFSFLFFPSTFLLSSLGVMVKAKDCGIVIREFVLQSRYYVHFRANTLGKGMNPLILPAMG